MSTDTAIKFKKYVEYLGNKDENIDDLLKRFNDYFEKENDSKLNSREQLYWLAIHGVTISDKRSAIDFLTKRNYFYKIIQYVKYFPEEIDDFNQLIDLSTIDMELRYVILKAALDVEHAIKTFLSRIITNSEEHDGYQIVTDVFNCKAEDNFKEKIFSPFGRYKDGYFKIDDDCKEIYDHPSFWFVIENTTLGKITPFVIYLSQIRPQNKTLKSIKSSIYSISKLRNKAAHSNGILNEDIKKLENTVGTDSYMYQALLRDNFNRELLKTPLLVQISILIYLHRELTSEKMHIHRMDELKDVAQRSKRIRYKTGSTIDRFISDLNLLLTKK